MRVNFSGLHILMSELFLYGTDIRTRFQQVGGEGMPQRVTSHLFPLAPFAFRNREHIENLLSNAGFNAHKIHTLTVERRIGPAQDAIPAEIAGNPVGVEVAAQGADVLDLIVQKVIKNLSPYRVDGGFSIPQTTFLFETRAGEI